MEQLEVRALLAGDMLSYHNDAGSTGQNLAETVLTPSNVNTTNFGKRFTTQLDGQLFAQPLYKQNVSITRGANQGIHNVIFAETEHDSLYAIDANTGVILWQDSFLNLTDPTNLTRTAGVTPVPSYSGNNDVRSTLIAPDVGITGTPVIDPATNILYLVAKTKERRNADQTPSETGAQRHFVQRLWAVNISSGTVALGGPAIMGDTMITTANADTTNFTGYQYFAGPIVNGTGNNGTVNISGTPTAITDGWVPSTDANHLNYDPDASGQIAFNALLHLNRVALSLVGGRIYIGLASHGDLGPYYGWILSYSAADLSLTGAFVTTPSFNGVIGNSNYTAQGGIWMSGGKFSSDGTYLYCTTGNGAFDESNSNFDANGFPIDHNYADCLIKIGVDPDHATPANQNGNGWGIKVFDYFCPSNQFELNDVDLDLGSSGVTLLPDNAGNVVGHPHLLILGGKEGRIYLIDRDDMGKLNLAFPKGETDPPFTDPRPFDRVVGQYQSNPALNADAHRDYSSAVYFNGKFFLALSQNPAWSFNLSTFPGSAQPPAPTASTVNSNNLGARGPSLVLSANGTSNAILWLLSINGGVSTDNLLALNASNMASLFNSNSTQPDSTNNSLLSFGGGTDGVTFSVPTVINGIVYCGTGGANTTTSTDPSDSRGSIVAYGLLLSSASLTAPSSLSAQAQTTTKVHLTWTRNTTSENAIRIERSPDGSSNWTVIAFVPNGTSSFDDTTVAPDQHYFYRVVAISGPASGGFSNTASAITTLTTVTGSAFFYDTAPQRVTFMFNSDVSATLGPEDLLLQNLTTSTTIQAGQIVRDWDPATKTATFRFPSLPNGGALPNGVYRATILASGVSSLEYGPMLADSAPVNFFFVNGDANHNGTVDVDDLNLLAAHWQQPSGGNYGIGDFDYDGDVDSNDLGILSLNWQYALGGPLPTMSPAPPLPAPARAPVRKPARVIRLIDDSTINASVVP
ncbi:MAG TPA: hypothetical protein VH518_11860 [Tepidisphaeraceae bacterium]